MALPHKIGKRDSYQEHPNAEFVPEIIVDALGHGDVMSIGEALVIAGNQTKIIVKPGVYHEDLVIDKLVSLWGEEGPEGAPIIWGVENGACIEILAPAHLKSLRFTNGNGEQLSTGILVLSWNPNPRVQNRP